MSKIDWFFLRFVSGVTSIKLSSSIDFLVSSVFILGMWWGIEGELVRGLGTIVVSLEEVVVIFTLSPIDVIPKIK